MKIFLSHPHDVPLEAEDQAVARMYLPSEDQPLETGDQQPVKICHPSAMTSSAGMEGVLFTTGINQEWIHFEDCQIPPMAPGVKMMLQQLSPHFLEMSNMKRLMR
jgi:hypothetical protein